MMDKCSSNISLNYKKTASRSDLMSAPHRQRNKSSRPGHSAVLENLIKEVSEISIDHKDTTTTTASVCLCTRV
jgi:hypothetical protein